MAKVYIAQSLRGKLIRDSARDGSRTRDGARIGRSVPSNVAETREQNVNIPDTHPDDSPSAGIPKTPTRADTVFGWAVRIVSGLGVLLVVAAAILTGDMLVHGHPAYAILLTIVFLASSLLTLRSWLRPITGGQRFKVLRGITLLAACGIFALVWWLIPSSATAPARTAMDSDGLVTVTESATQIVMTPNGASGHVGVFFQPGARVDARAYAAVLRPLAEQGHPVVIPKQPFGIAFLSTGVFSPSRTAHPPVTSWVLGGHSLGGVVSAIDADSFSEGADHGVAGLLFFASYPASPMNGFVPPVLSISASNDGLATPEKINASKTDLPPDTTFTVIEGAVHANFGDYGPQSGDGQPTISADAARKQIAAASLAFVQSLSR